MNFKTPFKVLTTAALIGTLSLSVVAPGAAFAAEPTQLAEEQAANFEIKTVILEKDGQLVELSFNEYALLVAGDQVAANGYQVQYIVADNGEVFAFNTYALASSDAADQTANEVLKTLSKNEQTTTAPENIKKGEFDEDGKLVEAPAAPETPGADALAAATEKAGKLVAFDYTEESYKAVTDAVAAAEKLTDEATDEDKATAAKAIEDAIEALVEAPAASETPGADALAAATEKAGKLVAFDYTEESYKAVTDAVAAAEKLTDEATDEDKATAAKAIEDAIEALVEAPAASETPGADALAAATEKAGKLVAFDYTEESYKAVTDAVAAAEKLTDEATDEDKATAAKAIEDAIEALVEAPAVSETPGADALAAATEKAGKLVASDYTEESYKAVTDAVAAAEKLTDEATDEDKATAAKAIEDAIEALVEAPAVSETPGADALAAATEKAGKLVASDYTEESYKAVTDAVAAAEKLTDEATDEDKATAAKAIEDAIEALVEAPAE